MTLILDVIYDISWLYFIKETKQKVNITTRKLISSRDRFDISIHWNINGEILRAAWHPFDCIIIVSVFVILLLLLYNILYIYTFNSHSAIGHSKSCLNVKRKVWNARIMHVIKSIHLSLRIYILYYIYTIYILHITLYIIHI